MHIVVVSKQRHIWLLAVLYPRHEFEIKKKCVRRRCSTHVRIIFMHTQNRRSSLYIPLPMVGYRTYEQHIKR